jgi:hypothetical protein
MFGKSSTPLKCWFYAMYLLASTSGELTEKELQRELGVAQKTACRIMQQISPLLALTAGVAPLAEAAP